MNPSYELLGSLLAAAIEFSGLPALHVSELPPVVVMSTDEMTRTVCATNPGRCTSLIAAFDTNAYRILVRDSLDLEDPTDNSFLVHEIVHVLQLRKAGIKSFTSCRDIVASEHQAYTVQNKYLNVNGRVGQQGASLRFVRCPDDDTSSGEQAMQPMQFPKPE